MKLKCIVLTFILFSTYCFAASFELASIEEPMSLIIERGKAIDRGESDLKLQKIEKAIDAKLQKMFPNGMIIDSKDKNFHFRKTYSRDYMYGNLAFELLDEENKPFKIKYSEIHSLNVVFEYSLGGSSMAPLPATTKAIAEKIDEGEVFDAKLTITKHKGNKKTYNYGDRMIGSQGIVLYCKVQKIY